MPEVDFAGKTLNNRELENNFVPKIIIHMAEESGKDSLPPIHLKY